MSKSHWYWPGDQGDNNDDCGRCEQDDPGEVSGMFEAFLACLSQQDLKI